MALATCLLPMVVTGQEIQNGLSYRDIPATGYFRFNYENDVFFGTDRYYTQGVHFELVNRTFSQSFIRRLFPVFRAGAQRCGVGLESAGYSPTSIIADSILYGDHPFAGLAYAKLFSITTDTVHRRRLTGTLSLGWMGPAAGGYEIQSAIHRAVGSAEPAGWKYQLKDQPVINYEVDLEQEIGRTPRWLRISAWGMARAGTLSNRIAAGGILNVQTPAGVRRGLNVYVQPSAHLAIYEAVLQGGPFTHDNPYRIDAQHVKRLVGSVVSGVNLRAGTLTIGGYVRWQTPTFRGGANHSLGGVTFATAF
jgi:hypothetical protein